MHILLGLLHSTKEVLNQHLKSTGKVASIAQPYRAWSPSTGKGLVGADMKALQGSELDSGCWCQFCHHQAGRK